MLPGIPAWVAVVIAVIGAVLGAAGLWTYLGKREETSATRDGNTIKRLVLKVEELETRVKAECEARTRLQEQFKSMNHHCESRLPRWTKERSGRLIWFNDEFFLRFIVPSLRPVNRDEAHGMTFTELFGREIADQVDHLDLAAIRNRGAEQSALIEFLSGDAHVVVKIAGADETGELSFEGYAFRAASDVEITDMVVNLNNHRKS